MNRILASRWTKGFVFLLCLVPLARLGWKGLHSDLTANPIEFITHNTGDWTLQFVLITLAITPARKLLNLPNLIKLRRMLGLFAFFYGCLHFAIYIWLDQGFDMSGILKDIAKRKYVTVGFTGFVLMIPLAVTSTWWWVRKLGGKRWQRLHRLVYFTALAGVIHYYWLVKSDIRWPVRYGVMLGLLMLYRLVIWMRKRKTATRPRQAMAVQA